MDLLESMQNELEELLKPLEENVDKQLENNKKNGMNSDNDRERMIQLTDSLDQQLFDCSDDLKTIIENMNSMSDPNSTSLCKVTAVLSNHIDTLNWVGGQTAALDGKLGELQQNIAMLTKYDRELGQ